MPQLLLHGSVRCHGEGLGSFPSIAGIETILPLMPDMCCPVAIHPAGVRNTRELLRRAAEDNDPLQLKGNTNRRSVDVRKCSKSQTGSNADLAHKGSKTPADCLRCSSSLLPRACDKPHCCSTGSIFPDSKVFWPVYSGFSISTMRHSRVDCADLSAMIQEAVTIRGRKSKKDINKLAS